MYVKFENLPDHSRIWIYQSDRKFSKAEVDLISEKLKDFVQNWEAHTKPLKASFLIKYDHFIILAVDEEFNRVSGCSLDTGTDFIKEIEEEFQVKLLNRMLTAFKLGNEVNIVNLSRFKEMTESGEINKNTEVFNNLIENKKEFNTLWEVKVSESWHKRYLI